MWNLVEVCIYYVNYVKNDRYKPLKTDCHDRL